MCNVKNTRKDEGYKSQNILFLIDQRKNAIIFDKTHFFKLYIYIYNKRKKRCKSSAVVVLR